MSRWKGIAMGAGVIVAIAAIGACGGLVEEDDESATVGRVRQGATVGACGDRGGLLDSPWPMRGRCPAHLGRSGVEGTVSDRLNWVVDVGAFGDVQSSPAVARDGTVYIGSDKNELHAIAPGGAVRWEFSVGGDVKSSPAIAADGTIVFGSDDSKVYAVFPDGSLRWKFDTHGDVKSSPVIDGQGRVFVGSDDDRVYALDVSTGEKIWHYETGADVQSSPAIAADGHVLVGSDDDRLYKLDRDTGALIWSRELDDRDVKSSPAVAADGTIYCGSEDNGLWAIDGADGTVRWRFDTGGDVRSSPAIGTDGTIYVGSDDSKLYAIHPDGTEKWRFDTRDDVKSSPAVSSDGLVYFGSDDEHVYCIRDAGSYAELVWEIDTHGEVRSSPAIGLNGTVYIGSDENTVSSIGEAETGFVDGNGTPIGLCNDNRRGAGETMTVCLKERDPAAGDVRFFVDGAETAALADCVEVEVGASTEVRVFQLDGSDVIADDFVFLTSGDQHCPVHQDPLMGDLGDDLLVATTETDYISGSAGRDYIELPRQGGPALVVPGDGADIVDVWTTICPIAPPSERRCVRTIRRF